MKPLFAALLLVTACTSAGVGGADGADTTSQWGAEYGTPESPVPQDKGPYAVESSVDLSVEAILPAQAELVVKVLRDFSTNPAHSLITLASAAGVPAVNTLYGLIPGLIKDKLEGFINTEVAKLKIAGQPLTAYAGDVADLADTALSQFAVDSSLTLVANAPSTHTLTALDFAPAGIDVKIPIAGLAADILTQHPAITLGAAGALGFGDQHFGLNYGEYAWQAINAATTADFGMDIHGVISHGLDCPHLAQAVADKCVLGVCVGHQTELASICQGGVDFLIDQLHQSIAALRIDAFHLTSGTSTLVDDDQDGIAERIIAGTWTAELNLGAGPRHAPATFTGSR
ncbi:hypothetical protein BH11MYX1_BH11MYX1_04850 [soil metagenome]